jgi:hypothetical protein
MYCFNGLKSLSFGKIDVTPPSTKESKVDNDEVVEKVVEKALAKNSDDEAAADSDSPKPPSSPPPVRELQAPPKATLPNNELKKTVLTKVAREVIKQILDSK